jgi:ppGpp synthetase/RelA/SpoT-type nucleotidyltranferase
MSSRNNPSWADFQRGFYRAGKSARKTAAYAAKRARLNATLMRRKKELAEAQAWLDKALDCMNELHVRSPNELSAGGRELVEGRRDSVKKAKRRADEAAKALQSFIRTRSNPTVGLPPIDSIDRSYYPSVFRDSDGDGFMDVDDPDPLNPSKESIEEVLLSDEIGHLIDERQSYVGAKNKVMDMLRKAGGRRAQVYGRVKSPYSLINKLRRKTMSKLTDVAGTMIVLPSTEEAAHVWSVVRANFPFYEVDGKIDVDDYYARPKPTSGYRAYHAIFDIDGKPVEVQIKTKLMKDLAAHSHHAYKDDNLDTVMSWKLFDAAELADNGDVAHREIIELLLEDPRALSYLFART